MGERALLIHASGSKHNTKVEDRKTARDFFKPKSTSHHEVNKKECEINIQITSPLRYGLQPSPLRIIEIWPSIVKIVNHWSKLAQSKQPKCKSYEVLKGAVKNPLVVAKVNFFSFLAGHLLPYLTSYQSQKPMIPFLHSDLQQLLK